MRVKGERGREKGNGGKGERIWVGQPRIITGSDILARLLTGIGDHRRL